MSKNENFEVINTVLNNYLTKYNLAIPTFNEKELKLSSIDKSEDHSSKSN